MEYTEKLTRYVASFVDELYQNGVEDVVVSPGSRSTPMSMTFAEYPHIQHWVNMDERSAAFFALGMAKQQHKPVALVCTSGTAAANYYPAIVEAYYSRTPLIVITTDRPHELRDVGAPQAIEQINMYGEYVKWFHEMALPEATPAMLDYVRSKGARAFHTAMQGNPGPIHLNFPFREPLMPDFTLNNLWNNETLLTSHHATLDGERRLSNRQLDQLISQLAEYRQGLIVCGPQMDLALANSVTELAKHWGIPILADPLSQLRTGDHDKEYVIESYDAILKSQQVRQQLNPDFIIRFGAMPVSKPYLLFLKEKQGMTHFVVEASEGYREPTGSPTRFIYVEPAQLCEDLLAASSLSFDTSWLSRWQQMNRIAKQYLLEPEGEALTEGHAVTYLAEAAPDSSTVFVGNSMPIRDIDTFFMNRTKQIKLLGNRGANGIDGLTSSALGAAAHGEKVTLLIGDLSFFHDFNALLIAKQYNLNLTVVLINNNGGGIFSFLPQSKENSPHYEVLFGTPLDIDFKHIVTMYQGTYQQPTTWEAFQQALSESYQHQGLSVIEVQTNRQENVDWHKRKWEQIQEHLVSLFEG
ncbi:2-succinyl-5-enolpyruvyl-6-hydroxy-3-cyclohexene-1-carboxylic-acid synthase [Aquibacillus sediminis]|uniref:2-succinyl-5-enolpyruvyl-6-hydroxy-3- cyclohexene-1-carboxylic-acid synthase n=1 Tax=Aquibacillus sediminis TaxID=2574734 RepID=UPI00110A0382|nr:2-succinyl-5-enolpyruvyl-6-hydroxy-3-cyclohexene-1-carboxylic-acid synthase [Aquibacillus sediminis]